MKPVTLTVILGTYQRLALLKEAIESIRDASRGALASDVEIVVVDGGSTSDDTRTWLATQTDITFLGHRGLKGAVEAYNHAFAYAVDNGSPFIAVMNDDTRIVKTEPGGLAMAVETLQDNPELGAVAFAFDLFTHTGWGHDHVYGLPYVNYGVFRREAGMAAAKAQGDPTGRHWWNPAYHTYAADCELGVWVWKLGWKIEASHAIHVEDRSSKVEDVLRDNNRSRDHMRRDTKLFYERWANEALVRDPVAQPARPVFTGLRPDKGVRRILITGGKGFLGQAIRKELTWSLSKAGTDVVYNAHNDQPHDRVVITTVGTSHGDLRDPAIARLLFDRVRPDVVIHAAAFVGGIGANQANPVRMFTDNMAMGMNVLAECARHPVRRVVMIGTSCSYPLDVEVPFREAGLDYGRPEPTNAPYGVAKRALIELADAHRRQHGLDVVVVLPANLYGEGDTFDDDRSHVVAAMIKKFVAAKKAGDPIVTLWGDGTPTRGFLHVDDAARGVVHMAGLTSGVLTNATKSMATLVGLVDRIVPIINIGGDVEFSMEELATTIRQMVGYDGAIVWDLSKPNGQPRRSLNTQRATELGWTPTIDLATGLERTVAWWTALALRDDNDHDEPANPGFPSGGFA